MRKKIIHLLTYLLAGTFILPSGRAIAAFDRNYVLPDYELIDWQSMDYHAIEDFLLKRNSSLADYVDPRTRQLPSQIISDASTVYQINPKVLLALLQKEQSLIDDARPSQDQYDWATGFAVCDSCGKSDPGIQQYRGFATQVDRSAWRFRYYLDHPAEFNFATGHTYLIDGQPVTMTNDATRALYTYTPHLHGNRNFYDIWQRWFARDYPDGVVLKDRDTRELWLIQAGKRRRFASAAVALSRVNLEQIIPASPLDLEKYDMGAPIRFAEYSLLRSPRGTVYLYAHDEKRGIESKKVFSALGFNPEEVTPATWSDLDAIPDGPPITIKSSYPLGALLQDTQSGGVWYVQNGIKHALVARELLTLYPRKKVMKATPQQLQEYETGNAALVPDGTLIKRAPHPDVAIVTNGQRRLFASWDAFTGLGYRQENIIIVSDKVWEMYGEGETINFEPGSSGLTESVQ